MLLVIIILFILICLVFIFYYIKLLSVDRELEELFDMYYKLYNIKPKKENKGKITVLNRNVGN